MIITKAKNIKREFYPFSYQIITLTFIYFIYATIEPDDVLKFTKTRRQQQKSRGLISLLINMTHYDSL